MTGFNTSKWKKVVRIWKGPQTLVVDYKVVGRYLSRGWTTIREVK